MDVDIRRVTSSDTESCGHIIYQAFKKIADQHSYAPVILIFFQ